MSNNFHVDVTLYSVEGDSEKQDHARKIMQQVGQQALATLKEAFPDKPGTDLNVRIWWAPK
jgi:hypothetical protein